MFDDLPLDKRLRLGLADLGLTRPTPVQAEAVPAALDGGDLLVTAETGSGKTLAYLLPLLQRLLDSDYRQSSGTLLLVLVPTRELARQVQREAAALLTKTPLRAEYLTGGADFKYQASLLRKDPEVLIATPGRLLEHCERGSAHLDHLHFLVLDEADRMLDLGLRDDVLAIANYAPANRQVLLLSATLAHRGIKDIAGALLKEPRLIATTDAGRPHEAITHQVILADNRSHKDRLLSALLDIEAPTKALVFANTRREVERLAALLVAADGHSGCLHGEMSTEERKATIVRFRDGGLRILCASDVAARGIDIPGIELIVNYDMPTTGDDYLHRSGRTGRAGSEGMAVSLVTADDARALASVERHLGSTLERRSLPGLKARYQGPSPGRPADTAPGQKPPRKPAKARPARKRPGNASGGNDGFAPLTRKKPNG